MSKSRPASVTLVGRLRVCWRGGWWGVTRARYSALMRWKIGVLVVLAIGSWAFIFINRNGDVATDDSTYSAPPLQAEASSTPTSTPSPTPAPKVTIPEGAKVVIVGDSWTVGYAATPAGKGYAPLVADAMGWDLTNMGASGTGYVNPGPKDEGTYASRIADESVDRGVDLVIIQGSVNDASNKDAGGVTAGATKAIAAARETWPSAQLIILGPCPSVLPVSTNLSSVDSQLTSITQKVHLNYVSCVQEQWITSSNFSRVIDASKLNHPSTEGHDFLAKKVETDLRKIVVTK